MSIIKHKRLNLKGGITLPKDIRAAVGLVGGEGMDVMPQEDGSVVLKKHVPSCMFTGSTVDVISYKGFEVSKQAVEEMLEAFNGQ